MFWLICMPLVRITCYFCHVYFWGKPGPNLCTQNTLTCIGYRSVTLGVGKQLHYIVFVLYLLCKDYSWVKYWQGIYVRYMLSQIKLCLNLFNVLHRGSVSHISFHFLYVSSSLELENTFSYASIIGRHIYKQEFNLNLEGYHLFDRPMADRDVQEIYLKAIIIILDMPALKIRHRVSDTEVFTI